MQSSERSESVWELTRAQHDYRPLQGAAEADVCVVGAGLAGMTTAYLLAREGRRVIVLDDNAVGGGETGQTTAHLASANDDYFHIGEIARVEGIECEYERLDGYWCVLDDASDLLRKEHDAAMRAGASVQLVDQVPGVPFSTGPALRFGRQGQFHPLKYIEGLARAAGQDGATIHTGNHVTDIEGGRTPRVAGQDFEVRARSVVVCTNTPIVDRFAVHTKQSPYRTFVIGARIPRGWLPRILLWDSRDPYHYVRLAGIDGDEEHELLIIGGEDHKTGHANDADARFAALEAWGRRYFAMMGPVEQRWSGQVMEPVDHLAFIGRDPGEREHVYIATGDSGQGMTHGTIAGALICDLILGRSSPWEALYEPRRKTLAPGAVKHWVQENADVGLQYADLIPGVGTDADGVDAIAPGCGAVVQRGASKVAVYRDEDGTVIERSALCMHLGCVVQWNSFERSWDCPCHGSRFAPDGTVLNGPAVVPLK